MTANDSEADRTGRLVRRRDRRLGLADLLAALSRAMADRADSSLLRGAFEEAVRRLVPVRSVRCGTMPADGTVALRDSTRSSRSRSTSRVAMPAGCSRRPSSRARRSANGTASCWASPRMSVRSSWRSSAAGFNWRGPGCCRRCQAEARRRGTADRIDAGDAGAAGADRSRRRNRLHRSSWKARAASAKSWWRGRSTTRAGGGTARSSRSTAPRSSRRCSRRSCSASRSGRRPESRPSRQVRAR